MVRPWKPLEKATMSVFPLEEPHLREILIAPSIDSVPLLARKTRA
mgnify:CR=1 FL=1